MATEPKDDSSPATKADIAALRGAIEERFEAIDRRFCSMEQDLDSRFDAVDRRFDTMDQQFLKVLEYIRAEGKESRQHAEKLAEETWRHFDTVNKNLQDYVSGIFAQRSYLYGEKFRELDRRVRALERGGPVATAA